MHEEQGVGQVFPRAPGISEALFASGILPSQASAEDPQVPPTAARASVCLSIYTHRQLFFKHIKTSAGTRVSAQDTNVFMYTNTNGCARLCKSISDSAPNDNLHRRSQMFRHMVLSVHVPLYVHMLALGCMHTCVYVQKHTHGCLYHGAYLYEQACAT